MCWRLTAASFQLHSVRASWDTRPWHSVETWMYQVQWLYRHGLGQWSCGRLHGDSWPRARHSHGSVSSCASDILRLPLVQLGRTRGPLGRTRACDCFFFLSGPLGRALLALPMYGRWHLSWGAAVTTAEDLAETTCRTKPCEMASAPILLQAKSLGLPRGLSNLLGLSCSYYKESLPIKVSNKQIKPCQQYCCLIFGANSSFDIHR